MRLASQENISASLTNPAKKGKMRYIVKLASLAICESRICETHKQAKS
jgi:hypothetical protein